MMIFYLSLCFIMNFNFFVFFFFNIKTIPFVKVFSIIKFYKNHLKYCVIRL
ncbi:hypothetical protein FORC88_1130 [Salmonella enterica subsp. enterica serovar Typhimurium]|uniref:Uncharacterized protein n=3 Tax=Salmonella enterica I TaxID=59201 RepID=A0A0N1QZW6_SALSV|nr:hypothetical protein SeSA_A2885 [Salmonella enterica subsp. enterica serovar Schwarzengrund str. CVM19633]AHW21018.1 hypothetical protein CFSAN000658_21700 [Salmonella enterica subsp. enterica serovar Abaetetuba str. ATCC 35640]AJQ75161.1 hypothetical protein AW67_32530 [Salmonella enterica subsp. enterica serovar Montevideo str. USDA-ARS-USMARC-1903]EDY27243.1 hypothetical protein SeSB_A3055 [Salmonella enterica subsp. enterica serovar Schwarzengrund str. SL480]EHC46792.1 hypothetical prote